MGVRIRGTLGDIDPLNKAPPLREPQVGFRRVPFKGSPLYYLGFCPGTTKKPIFAASATEADLKDR